MTVLAFQVTSTMETLTLTELHHVRFRCISIPNCNYAPIPRNAFADPSIF